MLTPKRNERTSDKVCRGVTERAFQHTRDFTTNHKTEVGKPPLFLRKVGERDYFCRLPAFHIAKSHRFHRPKPPIYILTVAYVKKRREVTKKTADRKWSAVKWLILFSDDCVFIARVIVGTTAL